LWGNKFARNQQEKNDNGSVTDKNSTQRRKLSEVGVYTVKNGKIVREEFLPRL
jgi:hypothetical protein